MKKKESLFWIVTILILATLSIITITYFRGPKRLKLENNTVNKTINWNEIHNK